MSAGNIRRRPEGATVDEARGMAALTPRSAASLSSGMFAVTACPPFSPFFSELAMVRAAFASGHGVAAAIFLVCLFLAFFGFARLVFTAVDGRPGTAAKAACKNFPETAGVIVPAIVLMGLALGLGIWTPAVLRDAWAMAVAQFFPLPMSDFTPFALLANGASLPWPEVPTWPAEELVSRTATELGRGARLCAWFGVPQRRGHSPRCGHSL